MHTAHINALSHVFIALCFGQSLCHWTSIPWGSWQGGESGIRIILHHAYIAQGLCRYRNGLGSLANEPLVICETIVCLIINVIVY